MKKKRRVRKRNVYSKNVVGGMIHPMVELGVGLFALNMVGNMIKK